MRRWLAERWRGWVRLWSQRETGESLALARVLCGLALVFSVVTVWWSQVARLLWVDRAHGGYRAMADLPWLVELLGGATGPVIGGLAVATVLCGLALAAGLWPRVAAVLGVVMFVNLVRVNGHDGSAYDSLLINQLWLFVFAASSATWSIDCRRRHGRWSSDEVVHAWPRHLMIAQLVVCYGMAGVQKLSGHWLPGGGFTALYYILQEPMWQRGDMAWAAGALWLTQVGTAATWFWEVGAPLLLLAYWFRYTRDRPGRVRRLFNRIDFRSWYAGFGLAMHLGVWATMRVGMFGLISLAFYPCIWHPREYRILIEKLKSMRRGRGKSA